MESNQIVDIEDHEFSQVIEIAYCALDAGLLEQAQELLVSLEPLRVDNPHPRIGQALVRYAKNEPQEAINLLNAVLIDKPDAVFTRALLAKFLKESGQTGWQQYAQETLDRVQTGIAAEMARKLLGHSEPPSYATDSTLADETPLAASQRETTPASSRPATDVFQGRRA